MVLRLWLRNEVKPSAHTHNIFGIYVMNLKKHDAISVVDVWEGGLRTDAVQQLHVMVRAVLDENYTKPDPFLSLPQYKDMKDE